jgi:hypothetical protein
MKIFFIPLTVLFLTLSLTQQPLYKNPAKPVEERVNDLLQRMTMEEMAAQLYAHISKVFNAT